MNRLFFPVRPEFFFRHGQVFLENVDGELFLADDAFQLGHPIQQHPRAMRFTFQFNNDAYLRLQRNGILPDPSINGRRTYLVQTARLADTHHATFDFADTLTLECLAKRAGLSRELQRGNTCVFLFHG